MYESIKELSYQMRLNGIHSNLERRCEEAVANSLHPTEFLRLILEDEKLERKNTLIKRLKTKAKFRSQFELSNWDKSFPRGLSSAKLKELTLCYFFQKKQNLIIEGKTGVGKTHLAISIGQALCENEATVNFFSTNWLFEHIKAEKSAGRFLNCIQGLRKINVLILDDFGLRKFEHAEALILLELLEERYGKGIVMITSQIKPEGWFPLFEDPVIAEAIIDRLINPSEKIELSGDSYRKKRTQIDPI